ncbi:MAG: Uma2 family endonuclease [Planctomycetes bacterium]|nr:Uma2 family endonuclease [Planctomycetota bacterium]
MNAPIRMPVADELDWRDPTLWPDVNKLVTEDDTPVDNPFAEKQMRLLTEPLYASWPGPGDGRPFRVLANVGLYERVDRPPLVPDVMLGVDTRSPDDLLIKGHRAWFTWIVGKSPTAVIEIVSNLEGGEDTDKVTDYADLGVPYYIIHDPLNQLKKGVLRGFALREGRYVAFDPRWLPNVSLGLVLWHGTYEDVEADWLRWCDQDGSLIMTGAERAAAAEKKAKSAEERAERLEAQLRQLGAEPSA